MPIHERPYEEYEFRLDNAAKIFAAQHSHRRTTMFRLSALIDAPVQVHLLAQAYEAMLSRCPYYRVQLRKGLFWYYLEHNDTPSRIDAESRYPCLFIPYKKRGVLPFRVIAYRNRISFEVAHFITDGNGALRFLNGLLCEYFRLRGEQIDAEQKVLDCSEPVDPAEFEESFKRYYQRGIPKVEKRSYALQLKGKGVRTPVHLIIEGIMSSDQIKKLSKEQYGVTVGEFFTALLIEVCLEDMYEKKRLPKPIRVSIPINLRRFFPSVTMRNFSLTVEPGVDPRLGSFSFEDIIKQVHHFMRLELDHRFILRQIARNIGSEQNPFIRILPLWVKDPILKRYYETLGSNTFTLSFSNLGVVDIPLSMRPFVERYQFIPPPHKKTLSTTSISYGGKTSFVFASTLRDRDIERRFFARLRSMGIRVQIRTNRR
ncbi:MAG: alcohol acetyltransferase [Spirochaetia bacterium]|nr:alcohol acetyltransferase [Spirochaetia bacterium]